MAADSSLLRVIVIVFSVLFYIAAIVVNALAGTGKGEYNMPSICCECEIIQYNNNTMALFKLFFIIDCRLDCAFPSHAFSNISNISNIF